MITSTWTVSSMLNYILHKLTDNLGNEATADPSKEERRKIVDNFMLLFEGEMINWICWIFNVLFVFKFESAT